MRRTKIVVDMLERVKIKQITQDETEAMLEALLLAIMIDGDVAEDELKTLESASHLFNWRATYSIDEFVREYVEQLNVAEIDIRKRTDELSFDIASRLKSSWIKEETYYLVYRITTADNVIQDIENTLLENFASALELSSGQRSEVESRVRDSIRE